MTAAIPAGNTHDAAYDLVSRARTPEPDDEGIGAFKTELQQALADPGQLPDDELFHAVNYGDGSDEAFLRRLWHDLYGDQPWQRQAPIVPWIRHTTKT